MAKIVAEARGIVTDFKGQEKVAVLQDGVANRRACPEAYENYVKENEDEFSISERWTARSYLTGPRIGKTRRVKHMSTMREALLREKRESKKL